jgi:hypothetical protein
MAGRQIMCSRKELYPGPLHIGRMGSDELRAARILGTVRCWWQDGTYPPERIQGHLRRAASLLRREGRLGSVMQRQRQAHLIDDESLGLQLG